jgi:hypothetical protein
VAARRGRGVRLLLQQQTSQPPAQAAAPSLLGGLAAGAARLGLLPALAPAAQAASGVAAVAAAPVAAAAPATAAASTAAPTASMAAPTAPMAAAAAAAPQGWAPRAIPKQCRNLTYALKITRTQDPKTQAWVYNGTIVIRNTGRFVVSLTRVGVRLCRFGGSGGYIRETAACPSLDIDGGGALECPWRTTLPPPRKRGYKPAAWTGLIT